MVSSNTLATYGEVSDKDRQAVYRAMPLTKIRSAIAANAT